MLGFANSTRPTRNQNNGWGDPAPTMARCVYRAGRPRPTIAVSKLVQKLYTPNSPIDIFWELNYIVNDIYSIFRKDLQI